MATSRGLLASLVIAAVLVAGLIPSVVLEAGRAEADTLQLQDGILDADDAVHAEVLTAGTMLDQLRTVLAADPGATLDPVAAQQVLVTITDEVATWDDAVDALTAVGAEALLDDLAESRQSLGAVLDDLTAAFAAGAAADPATRADAASATDLVERMTQQVATLGDAVESELVRPRVAEVTESVGRVRASTSIGLGVILAFLLGAIAVVLRSSRRGHAERQRIEADRERVANRTEFESRLMRGLEMAKSEPAVFALVGQAIEEGIPGAAGDLLVADSSRAHFRTVLQVGDGAGCAVVSPLDCPATTRGQTVVFEDDVAMDTCPHLRGRGCSATCVPVSVAGKTTGVVHVTGPIGAPPTGESIVSLEVVARRASERIAMVRAFEQTSAQANTDALTGLPNRRAVEERLRDVQRSGSPYCVAYCDLDRFKQLNDDHGHEAGDRALRLFARVLRDAVRPTDHPGRYGGEEFVLVLPDCGAEEARLVLERVRERLTEALGRGSVPAFTCSFGLATSEDGDHPESIVAAADAALLEAKAAGRDRVVLAGERPTGTLAPLLSSTA